MIELELVSSSSEEDFSLLITAEDADLDKDNEVLSDALLVGVSEAVWLQLLLSGAKSTDSLAWTLVIVLSS